ncbi:MAG: BamA/TamA family outer membrane protein [Candidatus Eisenbacteria sp.]|nr:BamA/TamA family outer membrane protein [Candidatus Eisenbacteria bacterium]
MRRRSCNAGLLGAVGLLLVMGLAPPQAAAESRLPTRTEQAPPDPDGARGFETPPDGNAAGLFLPRLLLHPARAAIQVATFPVKTLGGVLSSTGLLQRMAWGLQRERYLIPVFAVDPSLGINAGFRAAHGNPLHRGGCITYRVAYGGPTEQVYAITFRSRDPYLTPERSGWSYHLSAHYEIIPEKHYFGRSNVSLRDRLTYYTRERYLFLGSLRYAPQRWMRWDVTVSAHRNQISPAEDLADDQRSIEEVFHSERMAPGLYVDPQNIQAEIALTLDNRNGQGHPTAGGKAEGYLAYAWGTGPDLVDFVRYGGEGEYYLSPCTDHVLAMRIVGEEARTDITHPATGAYMPIKFTELPRLGGRSTLRGYLQDRYRDNAAIMATAEYRCRLSPLIETCLFADFGKVLPRLLDFDWHGIHRSWGGGLRFAGEDLFYFRLQVAASDEEWVFTGTLEPAFNREDRRERR